MQLSLKTPPATSPVSVAEAKAHLRVEHSLDDAYIEACINAALERIDGRNGWLRRALINRTYELFLPWFPVARCIALPLPPLQSVTSIKYQDDNDVEQTFSASRYQVIKNEDEGYIYLKTGESWPGNTFERPDAVKIEFVAGYGATAADVPQNIRQAILIEVGALYTERGDVASETEPQIVTRRLLAPHKRVLLK
jgi:uncharacterized phiE125 gp8 family phage protein